MADFSFAYLGVDSTLGVRAAVAPDALIDNEQLTREDATIVLRQRVNDPRAEDLLEAILVTLRGIQRNQGLPDATGVQRFICQSGTLTACTTVTTVTTVTTCSTVTTVTTLGNKQQEDGFRTAMMMPTQTNHAARLLYQNLVVSLPMAITNKLRRLLHRKQPEIMTVAPAATVAAAFTVACDPEDPCAVVLYVVSQTVAYLYFPYEDAWVQIPSPAFSTTLGAGACGHWVPKGPTGTTSAASATTISTNFTTIRDLSSYTIRLLTGTGAGQERTIASHRVGVNTVFTVTSAWTVNPDATTTWEIRSGRFYCIAGGTLAASSFRYYDLATNAWTSVSVTGLPATWGTDGSMVCTTSPPFFEGIATDSATGTTITTTGKTWAVNQWAQSQVRITSGLGAGQVRTIASNTADTLTVSAAWTTNPDATSVYTLEGNEDFIYLMGNNAITMYRYSVSGNTWTTMAPGVARGTAAVAGTMSWYVRASAHPDWVNESSYLNGRRIYSFRGGGSATLDYYDIPSNQWVNAITYGTSTETFATGSSASNDGVNVYIQKDATGRIFKFSPDTNMLTPIETWQYTSGGAVVGDKSFLIRFTEGATKLDFIYTLLNTSNVLIRELMYLWTSKIQIAGKCCWKSDTEALPHAAPWAANMRHVNAWCTRHVFCSARTMLRPRTARSSPSLGRPNPPCCSTSSSRSPKRSPRQRCPAAISWVAQRCRPPCRCSCPRQGLAKRWAPLRCSPTRS